MAGDADWTAPDFATEVAATGEGTLCVRLRVAPSDAIQASLGDPFWERVSSIAFEPGHEQGPGPTRVDIALHPSTRNLKRLVGLRWPDASRVCKSKRELALEHIGFSWEDGDHALRRFSQTAALPALRTIELRVGSYMDTVGELFDRLRQLGRPLERMVVVTGTRLAEPTNLTLTIRWLDDRPVTVAELRGRADPESAIDAAFGLGLPLPVRSADAKTAFRLPATLSAFARTGRISWLGVGSSSRDVERLLGAADESGPLGKARLDGYADRAVQITYRGDSVVLLGVYLRPETGRSLILESVELTNDLPDSITADVEAFARWLGADSEIQRPHEGSAWVKAAGGACAVFDEGQLVSLQAT